MTKNNEEKSMMKLVSRREFLVGGGAVIAAIALTACTSKTTNSTTTISTSAASTPLQQKSNSSPTSTLTPKYGGTLRVIMMPGLANIGWPAKMEAMSSGDSQECLETLLRGDKEGNLYPWLAESYKVADDLMSITFTLRKGIKFHDGSDFNAEVAKWNLDNMINAKVSPYTMWASVDIIDDYTIRVNFTEWKSTLPMSFAEGSPVAPMVSKAAFEKHGLEWMKSNPVGTGPFKFVSYQQDVKLELTKNPDYWQKGKPYLDGIENIFVVDPTTQKMLMETGEGDMVAVVGGKGAADYAALGFKVKLVMEDNYFLVGDTADADSPWANQKVREAVEYAIDRETIANGLGHGYWQAPYQIPSRDSSAYDPDFTLGRKYDPEKAKQLLAEAGYPDGFETTIIVFPGPGGALSNVSLAMQADLAKVGIKVDLNYPDFGKFVTYMGPGTWPKGSAVIMPVPRGDMTFIGGVQYMFNMIGQSWERPPELMQAYEAALASPTLDVKLIRAVTDIVTRDALLIPICEMGTGRATQPYVVAGINERLFMAFWNTEDAWLNK